MQCSSEDSSGRPGEVEQRGKGAAARGSLAYNTLVGTGLWRQLLSSEHCYLNALHVKGRDEKKFTSFFKGLQIAVENRFFFCHQLMSAPLVAFGGCHSDDAGNVGTGATLWVLCQVESSN